MKRARKFTAAAAFLLCFAGFALPRGAEAVRLTIDIPSVTETVLESGRDFYVAGRIDREGVPPRKCRSTSASRSRTRARCATAYAAPCASSKAASAKAA